MRLQLPHQPGIYNAVQKLLYWGVMVLGVIVVLPGLSIWKPVQLELLSDLFGGFDFSRKVRVPTKLGFKNPKHVVAIYVTNENPDGYWEDQGYNWFSGI